MYKEERQWNEVLAENLQYYMRVKGFSTRKLGDKVGVSGMTVSNWIRGKFTPSPESLDKICRALNVSRAELLTDKDSIPNLSVPASHPLPILGEICAGDGILADQNFNGYFFVDNTIRADYCLMVEGDSMEGAGIYHGDIAFLRKSFDFLEGRIYGVVFNDNRNAVLKRVYRQGEGLLLMPCNDKYSPIFVEDALICGEVIGTYHPR